MRCPRCRHEQRYRYGMSCGGCGARFVIDPKVEPHLNDWRVDTAAQHVGDHGSRWFTANQVVAHLARRRRWQLRLGLRRATRQRTLAAARDAVVRYAEATGRFPGLIVRPMLDLPAPPQWPEPDLYDYGAERIIVADDPVVVDLLVRTGVHLDCRAAIVSVDGYPASVLPRARSLVEERPRVPIGVLHRSGASGPDVVAQTRKLLGVPDRAVVFDLGLPPDATSKLKVLRWARRVDSVSVDCLPYKYLTTGLTSALMGAPIVASTAADTNVGDLVVDWFAMRLWLASDDDGDFG